MKLLLAQQIFVKKTHGEVLEESPFFLQNQFRFCCS